MSARRSTSSSVATTPTHPYYPSSLYTLDDEQLYTISASLVDSDSMPHSARNLDDVPEESSPVEHQGMYMNRSAASSASTFHPGGGGGGGGGGSGSGRSTPIPGTHGAVPSIASTARPRRAASNRTMGRSSMEQLQSGIPGAGPAAAGSNGVRRSGSTSTVAKVSSGARPGGVGQPLHRYRSTPRLTFDREVEPAPTTGMHWSKAPVWGALPARILRSHTATLVDTVVWIIGGNEDRDRSRDIYCFDTETMQWSHPDTVGEAPPAYRAHTATLIDKKIVVYGGGLGSQYFESVYVLDVATRRWTQPHILDGPRPAPRRAHTAGLHNGKIWVFGGGNGMSALDDVWTLNLGPGQAGILENGKRGLKWEEVHTSGRRPGRRGYHTASFIEGRMIVVGGSDGKECFTDIWILNLDTLVWSTMAPHPPHPLYSQKRLSHSATIVGSYVFIFGGHNGEEYTSDVLLLNLVSLQFEPRTIYGKPFSIRGNHATVLADSRIFLIGGFNGQTALDDVHILDLASYAYLPQVTSFSIDGDVP